VQDRPFSAFSEEVINLFGEACGIRPGTLCIEPLNDIKSQNGHYKFELNFPF
jgi:hypothetical protein